MFGTTRKSTREIRIGNVSIGNGRPVLVQSMTNTDSEDYTSTRAQIHTLQSAGCEIVRIAVPNERSIDTLAELKQDTAINIPIVADIHFDYKLAIKSIDVGCDKIRINPGNIGGEDKVTAVVEAAKRKDIPIRVGVNAGSLEKELLRKYGEPSPQALAESALNHLKSIEAAGYDKMVVSIKSSDLVKTVESNRILSNETDYPIHLGLTEAGDMLSGATKSAAALSILLADGIGDTIRISLTADPVKEIQAGFDLLRSLKLRDVGIEFISCPTCGRTKVDLEKIAAEVKKRLITIRKPLKVAIMGCTVNGPGEAREADVGIAGGSGEFLLFVKGKPVRKVQDTNAVEMLVEEVRKLAKE